MQETLEKKTHCWEGLTEYPIKNQEDMFNYTEGGVEGIVEILKKMGVNNYLVPKTMDARIKNTNHFQKYINNLKELGLDIGKGDCEYGYKMPLPENGESRRKLIIFKRKTIKDD